MCCIAHLYSTEKPYCPVITSLPSSSSKLIKWTHNSSCFSQYTFGFILTWTKMADPPDSPSSGSNMTRDTQYDFSRLNLPQGEYSVSIRAQCMENISIVSDVTSTKITLTGIYSIIYMYMCMYVCVCTYLTNKVLVIRLAK